MKILKITALLLLIFFLTLLTQVGGVVLLICLPLFAVINRYTGNSLICFILKPFAYTLAYLIISFSVVPFIAAKYGRVPLPLTSTSANALQPLNLLTCLLNRHYVEPRLKETIISVSNQLQKKYPGSLVCYLDANFPFFDGFPLVPHLSHNDGEKLDLAFFYNDSATGESINADAPSWIGYGVFEAPRPNEINMPFMCENKGYWQYSFLENLVPQQAKNKMQMDQERTKYLIKLLAGSKNIGKIFLEPHLKQRMGLQTYNKIRFQGCGAVRHDDHIHIQLN